MTVNSPTICVGDNATLVATTAVPGATYLWSPGGQTTASITVSPSTSTIYTVTVTDPATGCTGSAASTVVVRLPEVFANTSPIVINDGAAALPYPATINVSGLTATVCKVTVTLSNLTHGFPDDLDVVLIGPAGQTILLMSDAGGGEPLNGVTLSFDDAAASFLSDDGQIVSGTYKPTNYGAKSDGRPDLLPTPVPVERYVTNMSSLNNINPNGTWSLYVFDDELVDGGQIANGWSVAITTITPFADLALTQSATPNPVAVGSNLTFSVTVTNRGAAGAQSVVVSEVLSGPVTFVSAAASQGSCTESGGTVTCAVGTLNAGATATATIVVTPSAAGAISGSASVTSATLDLVADNNSASASANAVLPPVVTTQPLASVVCEGATLAFSVVASGDEPLSYQWYRDGNAIVGATAASYSVTAATPANTGGYSVEVRNQVGGIRSATVAGTVNPTPTLTVASQAICVGQSATLAAVTSSANPSYLWSPGGATTASITVSPAATTVYTVTVTDTLTGCGNTTTATVTVNPLTIASAIASYTNVCPGTPVTFTTTASGTAPLTYVWRKNGVALPETGATLTIAAVAASDAGAYSVEVTGGCNSVTNSGSLSVLAAPVIATQPQNQVTPMGNGAVFSVSATGLNLTYQWQLNGADIAGATGTSLAVSNLTLAASGRVYRVNVSNCAGTVASAGATLTVTPIHGLAFDFETSDQFTNTPYAMIYNDWLSASPTTGLILPGPTYWSPTGGVGVATGGGALDLIAGNAQENTIIALPTSFDFSLPGKRITASTMFKAKAPAANNRSTQIGFLTATNQGVNDNNPQGFMTVILQSTAQPALTYEMRHQRRSSGGGLQESTLTGTATLTAGNWYKITATFVNTKDLAPSNYTAIGSLQDMGPQGTTPGAILLSFTSTTNTADLVNFKNVYLGMRGFENTGVDYRDNIYAHSATGNLAFVSQPASQTVRQGGRAVLRAMVDGDGPYTYQWSRNGSPIAGAVSWKYVLPPATPADNGAQYTVTVTGPANTVTSDAAVITVTPEALAVASVGSVDGATVGVRFSQPVDPASAANPANYLINGQPAAGAQIYNSLTQVGPDAGEGARVLLTPASVLSGDFTVTVQNVLDLAGNSVGAANSASGTVAGLFGEDINPLATQPVGRQVSFARGQFEIVGGGADIFGNADSFRYVYTRRTGDFDIRVRVPFVDVVRAPSKAGIDVRASLDPFGPHALAAANPRFPGRNATEGVFRPSFNVASVSWGNASALSGFPDVWLRLRRVGNTFLRYVSANGTTWTYDGQTVQPAIPETAYVGLAVCAVAQGNYATAIFDNYGDFAGYPGATISIAQQPASTNLTAGTGATLVVGATATGGGIPSTPGELLYTWQRNNGAGGWTNLPAAVATNNILATGTMLASDNGAQFRVIVSAPGATPVTSAVATVSVTDAVAPTLTAAALLPGSANHVLVTFSEPVAAGATVAGNYVVTNAAGVSMNVTGATFLGADPRQVVLTTATTMGAGSYGVSVSGVKDFGGTSIATPAVRTFASQAGSSPVATGPVVVEYYGSLTNAGNITDLISPARTKFGTPDFVVYSNVFGIHPNNANFPNQGLADHYGVRMYTYFVPSTSGAHQFSIRADDYAQFLMNTNATDSTNPAAAVLQLSLAANSQIYSVTNRVTNNLIAGQRYYMEFRYKESTGGDGGTVAVRTDNTVPGQGEVIGAANMVFPDAVAPASPIALELYTGLAQSANAGVGNVQDLIQATNLPRVIATIPNIAGYARYFGFNTNLVQINGTLDSYLGRAYSYFVAPSNGVYKFYVRSDDSSEVWMNTNAVNSTDPAGARRIGGWPSFIGTYVLAGENISLNAGQSYYLETRWREGTGGDGFSLTFRAQGDPAVPPATEVAPGRFFSLPSSLIRTGPARIAGIVPKNPTVVAGGSIGFNAEGVNGAFTALGVNGAGTAVTGFISWFKNGVQIFANGEMATNTFSAADNGAVITCVVSNILGVASASTVVTVISDTTPPALVSAVGSQYYDTVVVNFGEPVDAATATFLGNYRIDGLTLLSATLDPVTRSRVSLRTSPQTPGQRYTVQVSGVRDVAQPANQIASGSTTSFTGWAPGGAGVLFVEIYTNIPGSAVDNLVKDSKFLNNFADVAYYTNKFGVGQFATSTGLDNYGARVSGYFMPPSNGLYRFYIRGDDGTQLFMNTNGSSSSGRVLIARNDGANSSLYDNGTGNGIVGASQSPILSLNYGTAYYIEGFLKEGGGGDHMEVVMRAIDPVTLAPTVALPTTLAAVDTVPGRFFSAPGNPDAVQLTLTQTPPATTNVFVNDLIALTVKATASPLQVLPFLGYQWQRLNPATSAFESIPGATSATFNYSVKDTDNGATFRVVVSVPGATATASTVVTVAPDAQGPRIVSAVSLDGKTIGVCFSEPVEPFSAGDEFGYIVNDGNNLVLDAIARADGRSAVLILDTPVAGTFKLEAPGVYGVTDSLQQYPGTGSFVGRVKDYVAVDVGAPTAAGLSYSCKDGEIDVVAGGADIWSNADQGHLTLTPRQGDFDVRVRVQSLLRTSTDTATKAGLMIRETLEAGSRTLHALVGPPFIEGGRDQGEAGARMGTGGTTAAWSYATNTTVATGDEPAIPNAWVRLTRNGDTFRAYASRDGVVWKTMATTYNTFSNKVWVGLATTAHNNSAPATFAEYRDLYIPDAPSIVTQPAPASQSIALRGSFSLSVVAQNPADSGALRYRWRRDGVAIAGATSATYSVASAGAGDSGVYTVDVGNDGGEVTSIPVTVTVNNQLPIAGADSVTAPVSGVLNIPVANLLGNDSDPEGDALSITSVSGTRPVIVATNFNEGNLAGATLYGAATVDTAGGGVDNSGVLKINGGVASAAGAFVTAELAPRKRVSGFTASFMLRVADGGPNEPADGFSFNFGRDVTLGTAAAAEEGAGTGVSFCVDNYRATLDGRAYTSGLKLKYGGILIGLVQTATWNIGRYVPVSVSLTPSGQITVLVDGTNVFGAVTVPYTPINGRFAIYGRTGGQYQSHSVDDFRYTVLTTDTARDYDLGGAAIYGNAYLDLTSGAGGSGALHLTDNINNQAGSLIIPELTPGTPVQSFTASFKLRIGNGSANGADGFSFNLASDLPNAATGGATAAEEGIGTGLSVTVDNYPTGGTDSPSFKLKWAGSLLGFVKIPKWNSPNYVPIAIKLDGDGTIDVTVDGTNVVTDLLTPYTPVAGRFGLFARTGGENQTHWIDDLAINVTTPGSVASYAQNFDAGGPGLVSLADGVVKYTPPSNACGQDRFYYMVSDGQVGGVTVGEVVVRLPESTPLPPVIVTCATNRSYVSASPMTMPNLLGEIVATDNCLVASVTQSPAAGTVLPFGATVVTFTATDGEGLTATCQATITVNQLVSPTIGGIGFTAGAFGGSFLTVPGVTYRVEYKDDFNATAWTLLTEIVGDGTEKSFSDPGPLPTNRFYRINAQ